MARVAHAPGLARGSRKLATAVKRLERQRLWPGAVAQALRRWTQVAHRSALELSGGCGCPLCNPFYLDDERAILEAAMHALPPHAARELRRMVGRKAGDTLFEAKSATRLALICPRLWLAWKVAPAP